MRTFKLLNSLDEMVAAGAQLPSGKCVVEWVHGQAFAIYDSPEALRTHNPIPTLQWDDDTALARIEAKLDSLRPTPEPPDDPKTKPPDTPIPPTPPAAEPPDYPATEQTVALWDWSVVTITDVPPGGVIPDGTPAIGPVSANNTNAAGDGAYTRIVEMDGRKVLEIGANHDLVQRGDGTGARLFLYDWGFWKKYDGALLEVEYAVYLPEKITIKPGGSLGLGLQTKHADGVIFALDVEMLPDGSLSPWVWNPGISPVVKPLMPYSYPIKAWSPVRVKSLLDMTDGYTDIFIGGKHLFHLEGRTLPGGIGLAVYNINAVSGWARALFSDVRFNVRESSVENR